MEVRKSLSKKQLERKEPTTKSLRGALDVSSHLFNPGPILPAGFTNTHSLTLLFHKSPTTMVLIVNTNIATNYNLTNFKNDAFI